MAVFHSKLEIFIIIFRQQQHTQQLGLTKHISKTDE